MTAPVQVVVAHKGAREHFLAARALHREGMLARLVTDWYSPLPASWNGPLKNLSPGVARALGAYARDLPDAKVRALHAFGLHSRWSLRRAEKQGRLVEAMAEDDRQFALRVAHMKLPPHAAFLGFSYASLEALEAEKQRGKLALVDQIDPGRMEWDLIREEALRWPGLAEAGGEPPAGYYERAVAEWRTADITLVNSDWSRRAIIAQGADPARVEIIPLAYETEAAAMEPGSAAGRPLTVLWLGSVILRKGIAYLLEAARALAGEPVRFVVAGPSGIHRQAMDQAPDNVEWLGPIPRSEAPRLFRSADVFILPTLSDGFAITQVEALAHGLPVITTPNCGDVVEDGKTGFIVPARDAAQLAAAIRRFLHDPKLAASMREDCLAAATRFSVASYAARLKAIILKGLAARPPSAQTSTTGNPAS